MVSILRISDENYRAALESRFDVTTCKGLTLDQAQSFIRELDVLAFKVDGDRQKAEGHEKAEELRRKYPERFNDLDNRPGMASALQLRKVEAMWADVSIVPDPDARSRALRRFIHRIAEVADLRFLDMEGAGKVINALNAMKRQDKVGHQTKTA